MNSKRGEIPIAADDWSGVLVVGMNAMVQYQDAAGETMLAALTAIEQESKGGGDLSFKRIRRVFWAICPTAETEEMAGDMIDALGVKVALEKIGEAVAAAFPSDTNPASATKGKPRQSRKSPAA